MRASDLAGLQAWFQDAVVYPRRPADRRPEDDAAAERHVLPSPSLTPAARIEIYADAYLARLVEVLSGDFVAVRALVGCSDFHDLVRGYIAAHPPRSFTLSTLGRHFPEYLGTVDGLDRRALIADVALVELAMARTFDAPRERALRPAEIRALQPEALVDPRPRLIGALELLELRYRANSIVKALRNDEEVSHLEPARTHTLVWRKDEVVWRRDLAPAAFALLFALRERASLAEAIAAAEQAHTGESADLAQLIPLWIGEWSEDGLFSAMG